MTTFILFLLGVIGLTNIIVHGKIMELTGIRPFLKKHLSDEAYSGTLCYECMGFWSGLFLGIFYSLTFIDEGILQSLIVLLFSPFVGSYISSTASDLTLYLNSKIEFVVNDNEESQ